MRGKVRLLTLPESFQISLKLNLNQNQRTKPELRSNRRVITAYQIKRVIEELRKYRGRVAIAAASQLQTPHFPGLLLLSQCFFFLSHARKFISYSKL